MAVAGPFGHGLFCVQKNELCPSDPIGVVEFRPAWPEIASLWETPMRLLAALISFGLAFAALGIDRAWAAPKKTLPSISYDGKQPAVIRYRGLSHL